MLPIVTPEEMREIDATSGVETDVLIERAGAAVSRTAVRMMGGTYGRRVVVLAGKGNNGRDGRVAARRLHDRGVQVKVVDAAGLPDPLPECDLVIDAAYGTGFSGEWCPPESGDARVLAVDIPSGVDGLTGHVGSGVLGAERTVTFAALKPGLLFPPGSSYCGVLELADIGLATRHASAHLVQGSDVRDWWLPRPVDAHKWHAGVAMIAGSPGMTGAAHLCADAAMHAGAGIVHLAAPGLSFDHGAPQEVVRRSLPALGWATDALGMLDRFRAVVLGPGLGRDDGTAAEARRIAVEAPRPLVLDGDGLFAVAWSEEGAGRLLRARVAPTVLTPHDGEYALLTGDRPPADRMLAARRLAADTASVVLLKGAASVIAHPGGDVLVVGVGDERLATAGTGDVLAGIVGAFLAQGLPPFEAAAAAAWVHGQAGRLGSPVGLVAGDLPPLVPKVLEQLQ